MILATRSGDTVARLFETSGFVPRPGSPDAVQYGPLRVPQLQIAAFACGVRLLSETIGGLVLRVYEGDANERRPVLDDPRARLFQYPGEDIDSFDAWCDLVTSIELDKHGFLWKTKAKTKAGTQVVELYPVEPDHFRVTFEKGTRFKKVEARVNGVVRDVTADVIHVRAWSPRPSAEGVSTQQLHQTSLRTASSYEEYKGRYFDNDSIPGVVLEHPGRPTPTQRRQILESWSARHAGPRRQGRPGLLWGGMKLNVPTRTLKDAQASELADAIARDVARMLRIYPAELLHVSIQGSGAPKTAELWSDLFWRFSLFPRVRRIERAISHDTDLFPDRRRYCRFDASDLIRGDVATTASVVHMLVQVGVLTKNEGRAILGQPPVEGGDVFIEVPVGGGGDMVGPGADEDEDDDVPALPAPDDPDEEE